METSINMMNLVMGTLKVREGHCEDRPLGIPTWFRPCIPTFIMVLVLPWVFSHSSGNFPGVWD